MKTRTNQIDYLSQAIREWQTSACTRRDLYLKIGRLLHLHLMQALQQKDEESTPTSKIIPLRKNLLQEASQRLEIARHDLREILASAMVVELLSDNGDLGKTSFEKITLFIPLIKRKKGYGHTRELPYADHERWEVADEAAIEVFRRMVAENLPFAETWKLTTSMNQNAAHNRNKGYRKDGKNTPWRQKAAEENEFLRIDIPKVVKVGSPREVAEILYEEVLSNFDPVATARNLIAMLQDSQFQYDVRQKQRESAA